MKIGFIGSGNMGGAIIGGIVSSGLASGRDIIVSDKNENALKRIRDEYSAETSTNNKNAAEKADILFLCVKPNVIAEVMKEIKDFVNQSATIVSIAAGISLAKLEEGFGSDKKIVRVMPNTPALVGEAMSAVCANKAGEDSLDEVVKILESFGKCEVVSEGLMDTVTAVSGSSPAYVFMMIEAMADAAVQGGMTRASSYKFAAQAVLGSAKMVLETGKHPGELKDMVCSPKGTTIDAVAKLEELRFRSSIIEAMAVCRDKSSAMG